MNISETFKPYLLSLLKNSPILPPDASMEDWNELIPILRSHWIMPLLYWLTFPLPPEFHPPAAIMSLLKSTFMQSRVQTFQMEKQLGEIIQGFQDQGVEVMVLKGPALARVVYPDPALRPSSDLDILVKPSQVRRAEAILENLGYTCALKRFFDISKDIHRDETYMHVENRTYRAVELHWNLYPFLKNSRAAVIDDFFSRSVQVKTSNLSFYAMHHVDSFVHAAINLQNHFPDNRLIWAYDLALLANRLQIPNDWTLLQQRCLEWQGIISMQRSLKMLQEWLDFSPPSGFADFSTWPLPSDAERSYQCSDSNWLRELLRISTLHPDGKMSGKIYFWFRLLFPGTDHMRLLYPHSHVWLLPFSYVRRWLRWIRKLTLFPART